MSESELIDSAVKGDNESFDKLIENALIYCKPFILKKFSVNDFDFDDAKQRSMLKAWRGLSKFNKRCSFNTWFYKILTNESLTIIRANTVRNSRFFLPDDFDIIKDADTYGNSFFDKLCREQHLTEESPLDRIEDIEKQINYRRLMNFVYEKLDKNSSTIIKLAFEEELPQKEIAKKLNIKLGTVMSRLYYARRRVQKLVMEFYSKFSLSRSEIPTAINS